MYKITRLVTVTLLLLLTALSCDEIKEHLQSHSGHNHQHQQSSTNGELSLDHGKKWAADQSTRSHIQAMQASVEKIERARTNTAAADFSTLKRDLQSEVEQLIQGCQMNGPAHDQLHLFLGGLNGQIDQLDATEPEKARAAFDEVKHRLESFSSYFD